MPHLFQQIASQWSPIPVPDAGFSLPGGVLLRRAGASANGWVLLVPPPVSARVNGVPVDLGIRALCHRDEITLPGAGSMHFSTEQIVQATPYDGPAGGTCPRCTRALEPGTPAVRCGSCGAAYHQTEQKACFTYGENPICVLCGTDAVVSEELTWVPDEV
jgi:hypothetical protein